MQGFMHAREAVYQPSHIPSLNTFFFLDAVSFYRYYHLPNIVQGVVQGGLELRR